MFERLDRTLAVRPSARVKQHRDSIRNLLSEHQTVAPRIFGSVARGDDEPGSDVVAVDTLNDLIRERVLRESVAV